MTKIMWNPGTMLAPLPPALISSGDMEKPNVMTAAWTGIICSEPVITYVSIRPSRYSHELISKNKEFVINIPTVKIAEAVDTVGVKSGRDLDKFKLTGLTAEACNKVSAPQVKECPISIECKVLEVRSFGTHDMFLAEVLAVNVDDKYINENGALELDKAGLLAYAHGFYYALGKQLGKFGFSVEKKKKTPSKSTITKADEKFGRRKNIKTEQKVRQIVEEKVLDSGVKVTIKTPKFKKPEKEEKKDNSTFKKKKTTKFAEKTKKSTNYEPYSFKKKSDGSFRKKPKNKA